jgi:hypothetical protein
MCILNGLEKNLNLGHVLNGFANVLHRPVEAAEKAAVQISSNWAE